MQRLTHAHDDQIIKRGEFGPGTRRALIFLSADLDQLVHDLARAQVAFQAFQARGAKFATHRAAHLGRNTDGFARVFLADAQLGGADDDGLNEGLIA